MNIINIFIRRIRGLITAKFFYVGPDALYTTPSRSIRSPFRSIGVEYPIFNQGLLCPHMQAK